MIARISGHGVSNHSFVGFQKIPGLWAYIISYKILRNSLSIRTYVTTQKYIDTCLFLTIALFNYNTISRKIDILTDSTQNIISRCNLFF